MKIIRPKSQQPLPSKAKRVFKGIIFDTYHWEQKMFDGSKKTFEKLKRVDTVTVIPVTIDGKILLSQQEQPGTEPFIGSFGGVIDKNESPLHAAERELLEETGMEAKKIILWDAVHFIDKIDWVIFTFIAKGCKKVQDQKLDSGEKIKILSITFDQLLEIIENDNYRDKELALKLFKIQRDPHKLEETRKLFSV